MRKRQVVGNAHPTRLTELAITLALSSVVFVAVEVEKWFIRRKG